VLATIIAIVIFVFIIGFIGVKSRKFVSSSSDFLLSGRELSMPVNIFSFFSGPYSALGLVATITFVINFGLPGGIIYISGFGIFGMIPYALVMARTIRRSGAMTTAEFLEMRYSKSLRRLISIVALVGIMGLTANNILAFANILGVYFGVNIVIMITFGILLFLFFTFIGGMWGVVLTDFVQVVISLIGGPVIVTALVVAFGSFGDALSTWVAGTGMNFFAEGIRGGRLPVMTLTFPAVTTVALATGISLVWGGQHYWMRVTSSRSEKDGVIMCVIGGLLVTLMGAFTLSAGLFAGAFYAPQILGGTLRADQMYGTLLRDFATPFTVYLLVFTLATGISTCSSLLMGCVQIAVRDFYGQFINRSPSEKQITNAGRISTIIICVIAWLMTFYPGGVVFLLAFSSSWMAPAGYLTITAILSKRANAKGAMAGTITALVVSTVWTVFNLFNIPIGGQNIAVFVHMIILMPFCVILPTLIVSNFTGSSSRYYAKKGWTLGEGVKPKAIL